MNTQIHSAEKMRDL